VTPAAERRRKRTPWRDNLEALAMAVIMALLLKVFLVEAYKIPTGSMQPTLIGNEDTGVYDRILVDKLSFAYRDPQRWEVVVFRYPLDRSKNFVKRVVGIGPEEFRVNRGDLWNRADDTQPWKVLRRPRPIQREAWKALDLDEPEESAWQPTPASVGWEVSGRTLRARGDGRAGFRTDQGAILDHYLDGYPEPLLEHVPSSRGDSGVNPVGDLRLELDATCLPGSRSLVVVLTEGSNSYTFRLPGPAAAEDALPAIEWTRPRNGRIEARDRRAEADDPWRLPAGRSVSLAVQNMDDLLELEVDGRVVAALEVDSTDDQRAAAAIEQLGEGADLGDLMLYRDIFYTASRAKTAETRVPAGHYFMMGDNTQDSADSREWSFVRYEFLNDIEAPEFSHVVRGNSRLGENPRHTGIGNEEGPRVRLTDEYGEDHWFGLGEAFPLSPETAPFVPREMILGRAVAVFWPFSPRLGLYRLKWVH
jgi:signal peptidase I